MEKRHEYKAFIIEAQPVKLRDQPGWTVEFYIEKHDGSGVTITRFYFDKPRVFENEEAAITAAIQSGKRQIDAGFRPSTERVPTL